MDDLYVPDFVYVYGIDQVEEVLPEVHRARREQWIAILDQKPELPLHTRDIIDVLVRRIIETRRRERLFGTRETNYFPPILSQYYVLNNEFTQHCLETVKEEIHNLICAKVPTRYLLNANRDTKEEVEKAIRFFPDVLSLHTPIRWSNIPHDITVDYPIHALLIKHTGNSNTFKNETFIALFVRLALEFDQFLEEERGGLLVRCLRGRTRINILQMLAMNSLGTDQYVIRQIMRQLKEMGYLKKEDIREYELLFHICAPLNNFMEHLFLFFAGWDPTALVGMNTEGVTLLCYSSNSSIECFRSVLEAGLYYYPNKKGISLLFLQNSNNGEPITAYAHACHKFGSDTVMNVLESTILNCRRPTERRRREAFDAYRRFCVEGEPLPPSLNEDLRIDSKSYDTVDALLSVAVDKRMALDGVYFFLRREPDILQKMLLSRTTTATATATATSVTAMGRPNHNTFTATNNNNKSNNSSNDEDNNNNNNSTTTKLITTMDNIPTNDNDSDCDSATVKNDELLEAYLVPINEGGLILSPIDPRKRKRD